MEPTAKTDGEKQGGNVKVEESKDLASSKETNNIEAVKELKVEETKSEQGNDHQKITDNGQKEVY